MYVADSNIYLYFILLLDKINISILFQIEGTFRVDRPPVLLGYNTTTHSRPNYVTPGIGGQSSSSTESSDTFISLFVTLDPPLTPPDAPNEKVMTDFLFTFLIFIIMV